MKSPPTEAIMVYRISSSLSKKYLNDGRYMTREEVVIFKYIA